MAESGEPSNRGRSCASGDLATGVLTVASATPISTWRTAARSTCQFGVDPPECDQNPPRCYEIDYFTPDYVDDPYGRRTTLDYEQVYIPPYYGEGNIRLTKVTDPSGRFIRITYACDGNINGGCNSGNWYKITA